MGQQQSWATCFFVCGEKLHLTITSKFKEKNLSFQKMWGYNNLGLHTFVSDQKSNLKITTKLKGAKLVTSKMWGDNNVRLQTFVSDEKSNLKITSKLKGAKLVISKNVGQQQCSIICQFKKKLQHELKN